MAENNSSKQDVTPSAALGVLYALPFHPGERVEYCGEEATVVKDFGDHGIVEDCDGDRFKWYWKFQGERVKRVRV